MTHRTTLKHYVQAYLESYPAFFSFIRPQEAFLFNQHANYIKNPILDFGSGDGFFAELAFTDQTIDTGLDLENNRNHEADKKKVYKKITYYDGDKIPFKKGTFKTVVSNCVLEHIPDLDNSLAEIYRILAPNGYFITSVMTDKWEPYQLGNRLFGSSYSAYMRRRQVHHNLLSQKGWDNKFKYAGFTIVKAYGYLSEKNSAWLDLFHYLSIPSLISYNIWKKWVIYKKWYTIFNTDTFIENIIQDSLQSTKDSAALFYILKK